MSERFGQNLEVSLEELLEQKFGGRQEELLELVGYTKDADFAEMAKRALSN